MAPRGSVEKACFFTPARDASASYVSHFCIARDACHAVMRNPMKRHFPLSGGLGGRAAGAPFSFDSEVAGMKGLPRSPSRGRVRDAKLLGALTWKRERARNLERRSPKKWASPRGKGGRYIDFPRFPIFPRAPRARRKVRCPYNDSANRLFAALRVPSSKSTQANTVS